MGCTQDTKTNAPQPAQKTWWKDWFNDVYLDVYSHRDEEQADAEIQTVLELLPLSRKHDVLDLCCGNGRHCRALHRAGFENITGLDYSKALLDQAKRLEDFENYVRGDMRCLPFHERSFDAVLSFFTSFGYFDDGKNRRVLAEIAHTLRPGGWFLMDYLNPPQVIQTLVPKSERRDGEYLITEHRALTENHTRIEKEITIQKNGCAKAFHESVRLYPYEEMVGMWNAVNLQVQGVIGDFDKRSYDQSTPRMILYGKKR